MKSVKKSNKKSYRKSPRKSRRTAAKKASQGADTVTRTIKYSTVLTPTQGALVTNYLHYFLSPMNGQASLSVTSLPEWKLWGKCMTVFA